MKSVEKETKSLSEDIKYDDNCGWVWEDNQPAGDGEGERGDISAYCDGKVVEERKLNHNFCNRVWECGRIRKEVKMGLLFN